MSKNPKWFDWLNLMLKQFLIESATKPSHQVVEIYDCPKTGFIKAIIKISSRHTITKKLGEIIVDDALIEGFDKKTVRTLTYMATVEALKPDFNISIQRATNDPDDYIIELKSKKDKTIITHSLSKIFKDPLLINKLSPLDANRIGYLAGVHETNREFQILSTYKNENIS